MTMEWELGKGQCGGRFAKSSRGRKQWFPTFRGVATVLCSDLWNPEAGQRPKSRVAEVLGKYSMSFFNTNMMWYTV